jgi:gluconolactonase
MKPLIDQDVQEVRSNEALFRVDPQFDSLVPRSARLERLATGFLFAEGPLWFPAGHLWFSDVIGNVVREWSPTTGVREILRPGGGDESVGSPVTYVGPNGMIAGRDGAVLLCQHGNRRIVSIAPNLSIETVVERYQGKRLNSPNDLVYRSDGSLYFTDPPYGLLEQDTDPKKELPFNAVFRFSGGNLKIVVEDMTRPNGLGFSPDGKTLYVANSDPEHKVWMRYDVNADGTASNGSVFFDVTSETENGLPDGLKLDVLGNLYCAGPGGVWVLSPRGEHLGTIKTPETPANCNWGDDGKNLYITATTSLYRIRLAVEGARALY